MPWCSQAPSHCVIHCCHQMPSRHWWNRNLTDGIFKYISELRITEPQSVVVNDNGLLPVWHRAISWIKAYLSAIGLLGTNILENAGEQVSLGVQKQGRAHHANWMPRLCTAQRRLIPAGCRSGHLDKFPGLTPEYRRMLLAQMHQNWNYQHWSPVIFVDESGVSLYKCYDRTRVFW